MLLLLLLLCRCCCYLPILLLLWVESYGPAIPALHSSKILLSLHMAWQLLLLLLRAKPPASKATPARAPASLCMPAATPQHLAPAVAVFGCGAAAAAGGGGASITS
jgi:hypothetical protein